MAAVKLYGSDDCKPCKRIRSLLTRFKIEYEYISDNAIARSAGILVIPTIVLPSGVTYIGYGADTAEYLRELGKEFSKERRKVQ